MKKSELEDLFISVAYDVNYCRELLQITILPAFSCHCILNCFIRFEKLEERSVH